MSPVVRVRAGSPRPAALALPELARALPLSSAELVAAARLAGGVPLPFRHDGGRLASRLGGGLGGRLAGGGPEVAAEAGSGPGGAAERSLAARGVLADGTLAAEPAAALRTLAGGRSRAVLDLAARRTSGTASLHCWLGVEGRLVARLATRDGLAHELAWHDVGLWSQELARVATLDPAGDAGRGAGLPAYVAVPGDLLVTASRAFTDGRPDLVAGLVADRRGEVRAGDGALLSLDDAGAAALLRRLASPAGRLRVRATSAAGRPGASVRVLAWLRFGSSWHDLVPGTGGTTRLRRREPADLGPALAPLLTGPPTGPAR